MPTGQGDAEVILVKLINRSQPRTRAAVTAVTAAPPLPDPVRIAKSLPASAFSRAPDFDKNPFLVIWEVTRACALACQHCRAEAQPRPHPEQLGTAAALDLVDQVAEAAPAIFILTGGDPMCRPDLLEIICAASRKGLHVALSPSATPRLMRADFPTLREAGVSAMSISIDGPDRASHDAFRGVPGTWDRSIEAIRRANDAGIGVQINTTITASNIVRFADFARFIADLEPMTWSIFLLVPTGRAQLGDLPAPGAVERLFEDLAALSRRVPFHIKTTDGQHFRRVLEQRAKSPQENGCAAPVPLGPKGKAARRSPSTNAGKGFVFVSHTGAVQPSGFLPVETARVRERRLLDVYRNDPLFRALRDRTKLKGKCGRCEFNDICGGSRARAYAMTGDMFAEDPLCAYQPARKAAA